MPLSEPVREIRRLGRPGRVGAIVLAEQAVDTYAEAHRGVADRTTAPDIVLRDLARARRPEPGLDGFVAPADAYTDLPHRDLARRAA